MKKIPHLLSGVLLFLTLTAARADLTNGLLSYWPMDATNGPTTADVCFTNTLSTVGPLAVVASPRGNAFQFNGSSTSPTYLTNYHSTDRTASGLPVYTAGRYTIAMWVKGAANLNVNRYLYTEA